MAVPTYLDLQGRFAVDFRNNDGQIIIGTGRFGFETRWTTAGNGSIHAYRDGRDVKEIAVAPNCSWIHEVDNLTVASADFSSRTRTPREGEIVLWRNVHGILAATQINRVKVTNESQPGTELDASYVILEEGSSDFSDENGRTKAQSLSVIREAQIAVESALQGDRFVGSSGNVIGIGHNGPPDEILPSPNAANDALQVLEELRNAVANSAGPPLLPFVLQKLKNVAVRISEWVSRRLEELSSSATKVVGAGAGAWLLANTANWEVAAAKMYTAAETVAKAFGL